jgi:hypothetical protein
MGEGEKDRKLEEGCALCNLECCAVMPGRSLAFAKSFEQTPVGNGPIEQLL